MKENRLNQELRALKVKSNYEILLTKYKHKHTFRRI